MTQTGSPRATRREFASDREVRWCPGCGDYAVLAQVQKLLPELGVPREKIVFVSGIGCASRFPYYMNTYGIHSIHGRAPTLATGLKIANPDLQVWVVTGDGDGLSIGGNHLVHCMRRNVDIKVVLLNNRIYGLTKGQYSPTSPPGHRTRTTPMGSIDYAFNPLSVALGAEASFVARTQDTNTHHLHEVLKRAARHRGTAFVEVLQTCVVFNPGAWEHLSDPRAREDHALFLEEGEPLVFGHGRDRGIRMTGFVPEVVELGNDIAEADVLYHRESLENSSYAYMLGRLEPPQFPLAFGVLRAVEKPTYEELLMGQVAAAARRAGAVDLVDLYHHSGTWTVG